MGVILLCTFIIKGKVRDMETGDPVTYADVYIEELNIGTSTDINGFFILKGIPEGKFILRIHHIGYRDKSVEIDVTKDMTLKIKLSEKSLMYPSVKVIAERERFKKEVDVSRMKIDAEQLKMTPAFIESDIMKSLQMLPGVTTFNELSNKLYIRGGTPDENLILLDGVPIYNPGTHLFGFFSTFPSEAVKNVETYTGGFPVKYGDRLSSVIDVNVRNGNPNRIKGGARLSFLAKSFYFEGPVTDNITFFTSFRKTHFDLLMSILTFILNAGEYTFSYKFYDFLSKVNFSPTPSFNAGITFYTGDDIMKVMEFSYNPERKNFDIWKANLHIGNQGVSFNLNKIINSWSSFNSIFYVSKFRSRLDAQFMTGSVVEDSAFIKEGITEFAFKPQLTFELWEDNFLSVGLEGHYTTFYTDIFIFERYRDERDSIFNFSDMYTFPGYMELKNRLFDRFILSSGMRVIYVPHMGEIYSDPRAGIKFLINENTAIKVAAGRFHQFIYTLNGQESFLTVYDRWMMVEKNPPCVDHLIGGFEKITDRGDDFRIEGFLKEYRSIKILEISNFLGDIPPVLAEENDTLRHMIKDGRGTSYGVELFLRKNWNTWHISTSYTYSVTQRELNGRKFYPRYDTRHQMNILISKKIGSINISARWVYASGQPFRGFALKVKSYGYDMEDDTIMYHGLIPVFTDINSVRMPPTHRLDIHLEKNLHIWKNSGILFIDIINAYWRKNVFFYYYRSKKIEDSEYDPYELEMIPVSLLPYPIVSVGLEVKL